MEPETFYKKVSHGSIITVCGKLQYSSALAGSLHGMEDYVHHQCVGGDICALSSSDDVLAPLAVCGSNSKSFCVWLTS